MRDRVAVVGRDRLNRALGDSVERAGVRRGRRDERLAPHDEQVLAGALADVAVGREEDGLVVASLQRFDLGERRVQVHAGALRRGGHGVGIVALPRADLHPHAVGHALVAEVARPRPGRDGDVDRTRQRVEAHLAVTQVNDRTQVAPVHHVVDPHHVAGRVDQLFEREWHVDHQDLGRGHQPLHVVAQPEHRHTLRRAVGADALEHAGPVVHGVAEDVNLGVRPIHHLAVHPDLVGRGNGHLRAFLRLWRRWRSWTTHRLRRVDGRAGRRR